jgi:hypothetical protein
VDKWFAKRSFLRLNFRVTRAAVSIAVASLRLWRAAFSHLRKNARHDPAELVELRASARKYVAINHDTRRPGQQLRS